MIKLPLSDFISDGDTLFDWMGQLWTTIYASPDHPRTLSHAKAILSTQTRTDVAEYGAAIDRNTVPVLHRERWRPVTVTLSDRDNGEAAGFVLGQAPVPVVGGQTSEVYGVGTVFIVGGGLSYSDYNIYPVPADISYNTCIVDNIANPTAIYMRDRDFIIRNGTLVIRKEFDPFNSDSVFKQVSANGETKAVLWFIDAMTDNNYVEDYIGYVFGFRPESSQYYKDSINAVWDAVTNGATTAAVDIALATMFGAPRSTVAETVEDIITTTDSITVITSANVYELPAGAVLDNSVRIGAALAKGQNITTAVRMYPALHRPDTGGYLSTYPDIRTRIPSITLVESFFDSAVSAPLTLDWSSVPIYYAGVDANGNPKLWFELQGKEEDVTLFWNDVWTRTEAAEVSLQTCFTGLINDTVGVNDTVWGYVEPLDFFLRNLIGTNTVLVSIDASQVDPDIRRNITPAFIRLINDTLPSAVTLFVTEHVDVDTETYNFESEDSDSAGPTWTRSITSNGRYRGSPLTGLAYRDNVMAVKWIPSEEVV